MTVVFVIGYSQRRVSLILLSSHTSRLPEPDFRSTAGSPAVFLIGILLDFYMRWLGSSPHVLIRIHSVLRTCMFQHNIYNIYRFTWFTVTKSRFKSSSIQALD